MATLTVNVSSPASLTISGTTQRSTTISWTPPTVPSEATITSCTLTGRATASMSKGSATIKVNGQTVSSGSNFTINLGTGNTTSSVTATAQGGNKNANGTVTFSNLVYTVNYTEPVQTYTVTFVDYNGTVLKTQTVDEGSSATAPSAPSREGYNFTGWDKAFTNVTSNLTVTAQYTIKKYTVTFVDYDGTTLKTQEVEHGGSASAPVDPVRAGHTFTGWSRSFTNVTSNLTVTAQYSIITHTVTFLDYDGTVLKTEEVVEGSSATAPEVHREGYFLAGWSVDFSNVMADITTVAQYVIADILSVKENGNWTKVGRVFKKVDGVWVEQANPVWDSLFSGNAKYLVGEINPIAILYSDGTLVFQDHDRLDSTHGTVVETYTEWLSAVYWSNRLPPWNVHADIIRNVVIGTISAPAYSSYWFYLCPNIETIDIGGLDTSKTSHFTGMFNGCSAVPVIDVSGFDTSNVTDMFCLFASCSSVTELDVSRFDTSKVNTMYGMFYDCLKLASLDVSSFDTSNVTDMHSMFHGCAALTSLDISSFDTSNVTDMASMFYNCSNLTEIKTSGRFNVDKVTSATNMFQYCSKLTSIDLSGFSTSDLTRTYAMFYGCSSLEYVDLSNFDMSNVTDTDYMFGNCSNPNLTIYVKDETAKTKIESGLYFPSTATVIIGKPN